MSESKFAGYTEKRALELILSGLKMEVQELNQEISTIKQTLANGNEGYGHLLDMDSPKIKRNKCGRCGKFGHNKATCKGK